MFNGLFYFNLFMLWESFLIFRFFLFTWVFKYLVTGCSCDLLLYLIGLTGIWMGICWF